MRRVILSALVAVAIAAGSTVESSAQERYTYTVTHTHTRSVPINWQPEQKTHQRYTISVSPLRLASNGLKFDFEWELPESGHWLGTSLTTYFGPARGGAYSEWYNDRESFISSFDRYHRMWGLGTSAIYKHIFSRRGWYFATGLTFDFFRVGVANDDYVPYTEDGMTFYDYGRTIDTKSYFKPTARIVIGKHMAISERCYFDLYAGVGLSYSFYSNDDRHIYPAGYGSGFYDSYHYERPLFDDIGGFAYRGLIPVGGFRFGVFLWKELQ